MPLYEFACQSCGGKFEKLMSFSAATNGVPCQDCGHTEARRLLSVFAAFSKSEAGTTTTVSGTSAGCACSTGGGCACCN